MRTRTLLLAFALALPVVSAGSDADEHASLATQFDDYPAPVSPTVLAVCFTFANEGDATLLLPSTAPWRIETSEGAFVWGPEGAAVLVEVGPDSRHRDCWRGAGPLGIDPVPPGAYVVVWEYFAPGETSLRALRAPFTLAPLTCPTPHAPCAT